MCSDGWWTGPSAASSANTSSATTDWATKAKPSAARPVLRHLSRSCVAGTRDTWVARRRQHREQTFAERTGVCRLRTEGLCSRHARQGWQLPHLPVGEPTVTLGQGRLDVGAEPMFTAVFGPSEDLGDEPQHRYVLRRFTRIGENYVCWVMLNPSIATPTIDDPTIRRVKRFSERWGFHNYVVVNLFAHRSTNPGQLRLVHDPVGPDNDGHIETQARGSALVVCAWGSGGHLKGRDMAVAALL